jgi:hypothetical protein
LGIFRQYLDIFGLYLGVFGYIWVFRAALKYM